MQNNLGFLDFWMRVLLVLYVPTASRANLLFLLSFPLFQLPGVEICLDDPKATIFSYVQKVVLAAGLTKNERVRRVWEPTYT